jgi:uncharacterized protein (DUF1501 family)
MKGNRKVLNLNDNLALHPDMHGLRDLYDQGDLAIVQNVGYDNFNQSHFRSTNIWLSGSAPEEHLDSGWTGRYLEHYYGNQNQAEPDPPGLEIGNSLSLAFHSDNGSPIASSIEDPALFHQLVKSSGGNLKGQHFPGNTYGKLLEMMSDLEKKTGKQADRMKKVYQQGRNVVSYPDKYPYYAPHQYLKNPLTDQLKTIARLISGGSRTRVYLAKMGGFDTHKRQVELNDVTYGSHACLLYHLSSALKAFQDDLNKQGLGNRVVTMTFSEFGRRAESKYDGSDHGKAAPLFVMGKPVKAGILGSNPDLSNLDEGNLRHEFDYRQVYTTILSDWMKASDSALAATRMSDFRNQKLNLFGCTSSAAPREPVKQVVNHPITLVNPVYPNPATDIIHFHFSKRSASYTTLHIYNQRGEPLIIPVNGRVEAGEHIIKVDLTRLKAEMMHYTLQTEGYKLSGTFLKK